MISEEIEKYIVKYLSGKITAKELSLLERWAETPEHQKLFQEYITLHYQLIENNVLKNKTDFIAQQKKSLTANPSKKSKLIYLRIVKYAALLLLFLGIGYFLITGTENKSYDFTTENIVLEIDNDKVEIIEEGKNKTIVTKEGHVVCVQKNDKIIVAKNRANTPAVWCKLLVPYGKRMELVLADGTHIFLNSGSVIEYPSHFKKTTYRSVKLIGEAYFDVETNKQKPFIVNANQLNVRVLGTEFNVSAYPEENKIATVLVEGSVGLYHQKEFNLTTATLIKPGTRGVFDQQQKTYTTKPVDTRIYTSWRNGQLIFRNIPFHNIIKRLERNYNIKIETNNSLLNQQYFNANFDSDEDIHTILKTFQLSFSFTYDTPEKHHIIIH